MPRAFKARCTQSPSYLMSEVGRIYNQLGLFRISPDP